ncbi:MAG: S-layer homology domain-containing protein, partial [Peptoniphilus harei]|nr:S-layer homology domain-containing protein [Peptoniphilus harei]
GMFQVVSKENVGYNYNIYKIGLRVIQSDNERLKPGKTLYFQTSQNLDLYDVLSFDGYLNKDGEIISDSNNRILGNPREYLNYANRTTRKSDFEDYKYFLNNNSYYNNRNSERSSNLGYFY